MRGRTARVVAVVAVALAGGLRAFAADAGAPADLARLTLRELVLEEARPLARHGYVFRTLWLDQYFRADPGYHPTGFDPRDLPADERARADAAARARASLSKAELERRETALHEKKRAARARCPLAVVTGGKRVVVQAPEGLTVWDLGSETSVRITPTTDGFVGGHAPALSRDGARVLAVEAPREFEQRVSAWDAASGRPLGKPLLQRWNMTNIHGVTADGTFALAATESDSKAWELIALDEARTPVSLSAKEIYGAPERVVVSADRSRVLVAADHPWLWRVKDGQASAASALTEQYDSIRDADLSPDGRTVAFVGESWAAVRLADADRPAKPRVLASPFGSPHFVSLSPDGRRVMAGAPNHALAVWELPAGKIAWSQPPQARALDCAGRWAAFLPGGNEIAMVDDGGGLRLLDVRAGTTRGVGGGSPVAGPEADDVEEALLARALGHTESHYELHELSFTDQPDLLLEPLDEAELLTSGKRGDNLHEIEALIYARRGRPFASPGWRAFAAEQPWYHADPKYTPSRLTAVDRANLALLTKVERQLEPRGPRGRPDKAAHVARSAFPACPAGTTRKQSTDRSGMEWIRCVRATPAELLDGPSWTRLPTGRLREVHAFAEGKEHGHVMSWYWSGVRKEEGEMVKGERQGTWRRYHQNGKLADESSYEAGKLNGPRRRYFESGKPALEASYDHGAPVGAWTAYYDNGRRALTATFPGGAVAGARPDGKPWPAGAKVEKLEGVDFESLPRVIPDPACPSAGKVPRAAWKPILKAARTAWVDDSEYSPHSCVSEIAISCAPDLDGAPGGEVLASISYGILINGQQSCRTKDSNDVWTMGAIVALSPPGPGRATWAARGLIGYSRFDADNGGLTTNVEGFVRLPSGEVALHTSSESSGGDCGGGTSESLEVLRDGKWQSVATREIEACDHPSEPEQWDVY